MRYTVKILSILLVAVSFVSCSNENGPNYQFMPNMYVPVGYEAYSEGDIFVDGQSAKIPAEGTVPRGYLPYEYEDTNEGRAKATAELKNPLPVTEKNLAAGSQLYNFYCAVCHGAKGDGQGILVTREKFLGVPSYADPGRNITEGSIYHVQMYGLNAMGSYTAQTNEEERWQITMYVENLMAELKGLPEKTPVENGLGNTAMETSESEMPVSDSIQDQEEN